MSEQIFYEQMRWYAAMFVGIASISLSIAIASMCGAIAINSIALLFKKKEDK